MPLYAKIDRATGAVLERAALTAPVRALNKSVVWLPVEQDSKPSFNSRIEELVESVAQPDLSNLSVEVTPTAKRVEGWTVRTLSLAACKRNKKAQVDALLAEKLAAGRKYGANTFQIRATDLTYIIAMRVALLVGIANPHNGVWRDAANVNVPMDDAAFAAFAADVLVYVRDVIRKSSAHKDAIEAKATPAEVDSYDISTGWPVNS